MTTMRILFLSGLALCLSSASAHGFKCGATQTFHGGYFQCAGAGRHGRSAVCVPFRQAIPRPMVYEQCLKQCEKIFRMFPAVEQTTAVNPSVAYPIDQITAAARSQTRFCRLQSQHFMASYGIREMAYNTCMTVLSRVSTCKSAHEEEIMQAVAAKQQADAAQREKDLEDAAEEAAKLRGSVPPPMEHAPPAVDELPVDTPAMEDEAPPAVKDQVEDAPVVPEPQKEPEAPKPAKKIVDVQIPDGVEAGQSLRVTVADAPGGEITFQVPEGIAAGETVSVQYTPVEENTLPTQEAPAAEMTIQDEM